MHLIKECKSQTDEVFTIFRMLKSFFDFFFLNLDHVYFSQPVFSFYIAAASKYSARLKRTGG